MFPNRYRNANTLYKVEHYQQDITNSNKYTLIDTQVLCGTTDSNATPLVNSYTGFLSPVQQTVTIEADGSTVVEYKYKCNSYTLTLMPENGENNIVRSLKYGAAVNLPVLTKTGHRFTGWDRVTPETMPAANQTYTALWEPNSYTILFDSNGGSNLLNKTVQYGTAYGTLPTPARPGHTFLGWFTNKLDNVAFGTEVKAETIVNITSSQMLYAKWDGNPTTYTVEHYLQNIGDDGYPESPLESEALSGTVGVEVTPAIKESPVAFYFCN